MTRSELAAEHVALLRGWEELEHTLCRGPTLAEEGVAGS